MILQPDRDVGGFGYASALVFLVCTFECSSTTVLQETSLLYAMSSVSNRRSGPKRRLIRGIALLFLIYTAMDIASPDLCNGEMLGDSRQGLVAVGNPQRTSNARRTVARIQPSDQNRRVTLPSSLMTTMIVFVVAHMYFPEQ